MMELPSNADAENLNQMEKSLKDSVKFQQFCTEKTLLESGMSDIERYHTKFIILQGDK